MVGVDLKSMPNLINRHSPASLLRKLEIGILKSGAVYHHGAEREVHTCACVCVRGCGWGGGDILGVKSNLFFCDCRDL